MKIRITVDLGEADRMRIARERDGAMTGRLATRQECEEWLAGAVAGGIDDLMCDDPDEDEES